MQINKNYETEIDLKDLFFHLCYRWRSIVIAAIIGAILLGAYQYYSVSKTHAEGKQTKEEKQFEIDLQDYRDSIENAQTNIQTYRKLIKEKQDYLKESVYMKLDSQDEWFAYKRFYIKMDQAVLDALPESAQEDPADYVAAVYTSTLKSGLKAEEMEVLLGTGKKEYIDELVSVGADGGTNTVTVSVIGPDEETVITQLDYFVTRLMEYCQPQAQQVGNHTLSLVSEDCLSRTDSGLSSKQDEIGKQIIEWQEALKEQREELNELEGKEEPKAPGMHLLRFSVIGFILGAFLLAAIYCVKYVLGGQLHSGSELSDRYGVPVFGEYAKSRARKPGKGLDKLFEKWEFRHAVTDRQVVTEGIAALVGERFAGKRLLLAGTIPQEKAEALCKDLNQRLDDNAVSAVGGLPTNADAVTAMKGADAVILVEEKYASRAADIERTAEMMLISQANVGGCIVL